MDIFINGTSKCWYKFVEQNVAIRILDISTMVSCSIDNPVTGIMLALVPRYHSSVRSGDYPIIKIHKSQIAFYFIILTVYACADI